MTDSELKWDSVLHIQTCGRDDTNSDEYNHPYEPTPYCVLKRLADSGYFGENDVILDYGSGMGRVGFFMYEHTGSSVIGIEYDEHIYKKALDNSRSFGVNKKINFVLKNAVEFTLPIDVNRCYFFNPFSVEILRKTVDRVLDSYYETPREILFFFYYPSDEYLGYLMTLDELEFYDEIDCSDLFDTKDKRERILVFCLPDLDFAQ